jgi:hypothetical protein
MSSHIRELERVGAVPVPVSSTTCGVGSGIAVA